VINGCSLGKKMVSVCASNDFSASSGYLQYRFGQKDTLELAFPNLAESARASQSVQARTLMFAGGGGGYLRFINGQHHYIVYTAIGKGWGAKDGVAVEKNNQLIANLECQDIPENAFTMSGTGRKRPLCTAQSAQLQSVDACCPNAHGFSLHAGVRCAMNQRSKLERLFRYITRPAIADECLARNKEGQSLPP